MARTAVIAGTASAVSGRVQAGQQAKAQQANQAQAYQEQQAAEQAAALAAQQQAAAAAAAPAAPAQGGLIAELEKLASLKAAGILTDDEFAAAKAKLLG